MNHSKTSNLSVWKSSPAESWQPRVATGVMELGVAGLVSVGHEPHRPTEVVIQPLYPVAGVIGAMVVAESSSRRVSLNGVPLAAGIHLLRHADRVDIDQQTFWISTQATVEETTYDPAVHGEEVFCFLTKARLTEGQPIKICPGVPGNDCGVIYKAAAWDMAMQSSTPLKCPNCGYRSGHAEWHPPELRTRKTIDGILQLINN